VPFGYVCVADVLIEDRPLTWYHHPPTNPFHRTATSERLFGTGSQTNAFTDFHHTVYFACCPVDTLNLLGRPRPMLPMALDALSEVRGLD
jgi:hypothetical protein